MITCLLRSSLVGKVRDTMHGAIAFAGMMVGAIIWGNLADRIGRKPTLMTSLTLNAVFSVIGCVMPNYVLFLICRLVSGVGIGGSIPIVFAYFAEFCPKAGRGQKMGLLLTFWAMGGVYVAGLGWLIIPYTDFDLPMWGDNHFRSWRVFMVICALPIFISVFGLFALPESPRYLLQVGRDLDALSVYRKIYVYNHSEPGAEYQMPEIELPTEHGYRPAEQNPPKGIRQGCLHAFEHFWDSFFQLFYTPLTTITLVLCFTWFSTAFGYYGLTIWFPEYIKKLEQEAYLAKRVTIVDTVFREQTFTGIMDNKRYYKTKFENVIFTDITFQHVTFDNCIITACTFVSTVAKKTYFLDSTVTGTLFNNTNFFKSRFINTPQVNTSFLNMATGCEVDFDTNYSTKQVFLENFLGQLSVIPSTIVVSLLLDKLGRVRILTGSLVLCGVCVFFIWFSNTETTVVAMNCVFNFFVTAAWNGIDVLNTELYPTQLRSTAFGFLSSLGRIAAILGNVVFGNFISVSKSIPIITTSVVMLSGGLLSLKLPESKDKLL